MRTLRAACTGLCLLGAALAPVACADGAASAASPASALTVSAPASGPTIPDGFVGLSMEFRGLAAYVGTDPRAVDPAFEQLVRDIAPGQRPVLRIGGDSTDWTWWPVAHMARPPGVKYDLTPGYLAVARSLAQTLDARMIMGINLEANSQAVAGAEARAFVDRLGRRAVSALEIGNEPELYGSFSWYKTPSGQHVDGRPHGYDLPAFISDFTRMARAMPNVALSGPDSGSPHWLPQLGTFLDREPRVGLVSLHAYPLKHCVATNVVTEAELLADSATHGLAARVAPYIDTAARHHVPARIDEINAVSCGGARGVSDTFGSALWSLDALFELARTGVGGVNVHTVPGTINEILGPSFTGGHWQISVHPEYYGLVMFAQAAPAGSRLLALTGAQTVGVKTWATLAHDRTLRVTLINKHVRQGETVRLRLLSGYGQASVEQLRAPSVTATSGITLGGQSFGSETSTGTLAGPSQTSTLAPAGGTYVVHLPAASATLLVLPHS
ncbi:MAG TPA: glycosyl hydrolase family protein [Solirubrobacteraceae bacterium]